MTDRNGIDDLIRHALHARADQVTAGDLTPASPPHSEAFRTRTRIRWAAPLLAAAAVAAVAVGTAMVVSEPDASRHNPIGGNHSSSSSNQPTSTSATATPSTVPQSSTHCYFADLGCTSATYYVPLWPFANWQQAKQWAAVDGPAGHSPWHSDAAATAQFFTNNYLGFTDLPEITSTTIGPDGAHIGVGHKDPNGQLHTAAVVHLLRYTNNQADTSSPWEVVGTDDTTFSLETPGYDSTVSSPLTVGGHITGVDENIHAWVRAIDKANPLGTACCTPAGGDNSPWHVTVSYSSHAGPITIIVSTGGHLIEHERFAVQGVIANR